MLRVQRFVFNTFGENTYLVINPETSDAAVVDPGMNTARECAEFDRFVADNSLKITQIINTHLHVDHCFGDNYVRARYGAKVASHPDDAFLGERVAAQMRAFGMLSCGGEPEPVVSDAVLRDGDLVAVGDDELLVLHVPGHSPGSIALYSATGGFVLTGDALFQGSIGRTDLPGGSHPQLVAAIRKKLLTLPAATTVYPGHGPATTIGAEARYNPYL